jgi:hypothetical protein
MPAVRVATMADVEYLAPRLRKADVDELRAGHGNTALEALTLGLEVSEPPLVGVDDDDKAVIMFGVTTLEEGLLGGAWMLSSDEIYKHHFTFLKHSRRILDEFNDRWPVLTNVCDERNVDHIRWMRWLDYTFLARHPNYGVEKRPFIEFVRVKHVRPNYNGRSQLRDQRRLNRERLHGAVAGG